MRISQRFSEDNVPRRERVERSLGTFPATVFPVDTTRHVGFTQLLTHRPVFNVLKYYNCYITRFERTPMQRAQ